MAAIKWKREKEREVIEANRGRLQFVSPQKHARCSVSTSCSFFLSKRVVVLCLGASTSFVSLLISFSLARSFLTDYIAPDSPAPSFELEEISVRFEAGAAAAKKLKKQQSEESKRKIIPLWHCQGRQIIRLYTRWSAEWLPIEVI